MIRAWKIALVGCTAGATVLGGTMVAFAQWTVSSNRVVMQLQTVAVPEGPQPSVDAREKNVVLRWAPKRLQPGVKVQSYVVTRHSGSTSVEVCVVNSTGCKDTNATAGVWTYRIRTRYEGWEGADGPASEAVTIVTPTRNRKSPAAVPPTGATTMGTGTVAPPEKEETVEPDTAAPTPANTSVTPTEPAADESTEPPPQTQPTDPPTTVE